MHKKHSEQCLGYGKWIIKLAIYYDYSMIFFALSEDS